MGLLGEIFLQKNYFYTLQSYKKRNNFLYHCEEKVIKSNKSFRNLKKRFFLDFEKTFF